ncbi:hypothetical protein QPK87_19305 [Kamptonema cortianum]|nr:hypothetical protein [Geitlerinema splendidum]MDK3158704.1 hypothetical protein [Kamptonema cortianum]
MIRIVGVQRSESTDREFIVVQNQGNMRINLRGHALVADSAVDEPAGLQQAFVLADDVDIPPGFYAVIRTGSGQPGWCHKHDGYHIYYAYLGRCSPIWNCCSGPIHLLAPQHTYVERQAEALKV